ncbi:MAG: DUF4105 domain-containing protein [Dysgonamonadaceae bacterium]|jgi:hypothetical protein|nr:DUF4105 domain-containing protein [Dysgonamonadaceae bacterium]
MMRKIVFFFCCFCCFAAANAQHYDNTRISLLTVMPRSNAVYTVFGHTAVRISDSIRGYDIVLNWGTFDFDRPNFLYHFVKGETDYFLTLASIEDFMRTYKRGNATVVEQQLNIPDSLKSLLIRTLDENLKPENVEYRYNYFFDNCTLRPRDIVERFCGGTIIYPAQTEELTFRSLVHGLTRDYPWLEFGIDFLIGSGADSLISERTSLFLPERLMTAFDAASVQTDGGSLHPLVLSKQTLIDSQQNGENKSKNNFIFFLQLPVTVSYILFFIVLYMAIAGIVKNKRFAWFSLLFFIAGLGGCLIAFVTFFSVHPCTNPNWNLLWMHPLQFIGLASFFPKRKFRLFLWYHAINLVLLFTLLFVSIWVQELNKAFTPLIYCLIMSSVYYIKVYGKKI